MAGCFGQCRQEFRLKKFGFCDVKDACFTSFQWRLPPLLYVIYRVVLALYSIYWLIETAIEFVQNSRFPHPYPVYLTNWSYSVLVLYLTVHALAASFRICRRPKHMSIWERTSEENHYNRVVLGERIVKNRSNEEPMQNQADVVDLGKDEVKSSGLPHKFKGLPWFFKITWVLYNISSTMCIIVSVVFFGFMWPLMSDGQTIDNMNLQLHGISSLIIFIEHLVSAVPVRLLHLIYPAIFGTMYVTFTLIYFGSGNTEAIYPKLLDWRAGNAAQSVLVITILAVVGMPLVQVILFMITKIKWSLSKYIYQNINQVTE